MNEKKPNGQELVSRPARVIGIIFLGVAFLALGWCIRGIAAPGGGQPPAGPPMMGPERPPAVVVHEVEAVRLNPVREFIGHVEPIQAVDLRAHIAGYIQTVHFDEGGFVEKGTLLVTIQQQDFKARVALAKATLAQAHAGAGGALADVDAANANLDAAVADRIRADKFLARLHNADERSVVQADLDAAESVALQCKARVAQCEARCHQAQSGVQQAEAQIQSTTAALELAYIDLGYTEIRAPIAGQVGRALFTEGDLVSPAAGALVRIVQIDPIRVVYSLTDREYLDIPNPTADALDDRWEINIRHSNGDRYPLPGVWDFQNNEMNPLTGSIPVRAMFQNNAGRLVPGSYITVLMEESLSPKVVAVPQQSLLIDTHGASVLVVDGDGVVEARPVQLGQTSGVLQEVLSGVSVGETIIVRGTLKARPGQRVEVIPVHGDSVGAES